MKCLIQQHLVLIQPKVLWPRPEKRKEDSSNVKVSDGREEACGNGGQKSGPQKIYPSLNL